MATSPYAQTKIFIEHILKDLSVANKHMSIISLRYFNPCGAHPSGLIGDAPVSPNNLFPTVELVAVGKRDKL
jgi:UDP-glucose 4-epimerase